MKTQNNQKSEEKKAERAKKCLAEVEKILKKYNCSIVATITFDEESGKVFYDKKILAKD